MPRPPKVGLPKVGLPKRDVPAVQESKNVDIARVTHNQFRLLLVEDDQEAREALARYLSDTFPDIYIETSWCGSQATGYLRRETYNLVVTDYHMSHGDGKEVVRYCARNRSSVPVVVFTQTTDEDDTFIELGARVVIHKDLNVLVAFITEQMKHQDFI